MEHLRRASPLSKRRCWYLPAQPGCKKRFLGELGVDVAQLATQASQGCPWDSQTVIAVRGDRAGGGHRLVSIPRGIMQHPRSVTGKLNDVVVGGL